VRQRAGCSRSSAEAAVCSLGSLTTGARFGGLFDERYVSLTRVWIVALDGLLYPRTDAASGNVSRALSLHLSFFWSTRCSGRLTSPAR